MGGCDCDMGLSFAISAYSGDHFHSQGYKRKGARVPHPLQALFGTESTVAHRMKTRSPLAIVAGRLGRAAVLLALCQIVGTAWHEVVGHGLTGVLCGGRIESVVILGVQAYPALRWEGWIGEYGNCGVDGVEGATRGQIMSLGGSLSTWLVSVVAVALLWVRRWRGWPRTLLAMLGLWWIDMLTYILPTWGIPRSVLWGQAGFSEPYEAAVGLGLPGPMFQTLVVISSVVLAAGLVGGLLRRGRPAAPPAQ